MARLLRNRGDGSRRGCDRADIRPRPPASTGRGAAAPIGRAAAYRAARPFFRDKAGRARHAGLMFRLEQDGAAARLVLDRPAARNAIPATGWAALAGTLDRVGAGDARLLVVMGAGGSFCAGADLAGFGAMRSDPAAIARFREEMRNALDRLRALPIPTVALVHGHCYGAGVALAMACDLRIAASCAAFAITPAKIGISYPQEDVQRLVELVGPGQAARLLFTALPIDGEEARRIGLADLLTPGEEEIFEAILANDRESLAVLKQAIARAAGGVRSDAALDRRFDELIGGGELGRRLEALRRK
jgi:enoyl-CoA hydratase/carnithine racemase